MEATRTQIPVRVIDKATPSYPQSVENPGPQGQRELDTGGFSGAMAHSNKRQRTRKSSEPKAHALNPPRGRRAARTHPPGCRQSLREGASVRPCGGCPHRGEGPNRTRSPTGKEQLPVPEIIFKPRHSTRCCSSEEIAAKMFSRRDELVTLRQAQTGSHNAPKDALRFSSNVGPQPLGWVGARQHV
jgi:hypothetical protein